MKIKATMIVILLFSFSAFGKTEKLSDLGRLKNQFLKASILNRAVDADSIANIYDAEPVNDYEEFKAKLAPDAGAVVTRLYKREAVKSSSSQKLKPSRLKFNIFGSSKKEL